MQPQTSPSLGDAEITELYQRYAHTLLAFIRRYASTREDAEDVLLEVFIAALDHGALADMSDGEQLAWLRRVARNKCIDAYRRAQRRQAVTLDSVAEFLYEDEECAPEQLVLRSEEHALLRHHLAHLPQQQQAVVRLRFAQGLRCVEIAKTLNKSESAVRMLLSRALNLLRGTYEQQARGGNKDE
jgi:RNA polymerase sigma-70 factor (ECF subfamily)